MSERATHTVYLMGGLKEDDTLFVQEVFPETKRFDQAIRGANARLIANAADAELFSINQDIEPRWIECVVYDKNGNEIGRTPRRYPIFESVADDVAKMLHKEKVTITIR